MKAMNNKKWNVAHEVTGGFTLERGKTVLTENEFEKLKAISNCNWIVFYTASPPYRPGVTSLNFNSAE